MRVSPGPGFDLHDRRADRVRQLLGAAQRLDRETKCSCACTFISHAPMLAFAYEPVCSAPNTDVSGKIPQRARAILAAFAQEPHLREQLIHVLTEAAEIEHNLLCSYLYAAFSLKRGVDEDLTPAEAAAVSRWRKSVMSVALEEM